MELRNGSWLNAIDGRLRRRLPRPVYTGMLRGFHGARTLVGRNPGRGCVLPDFVVIGAAKCGTTSIYAWLAEHPFVRRPRRKEIDYFTFHYYRGTDWYRHHFPRVSDQRAFAAEHGRPFITGEASPNYMLFERGPERMARLLPDVKLVVALRNPADRAYSQFHMRRRTELEPHESFADALAAEDPSFEFGAHTDPIPVMGRRSYLSRGHYAEQLERWFWHFRREQFQIITFEDLAAEPHRVLAELHQFLGLAPREADDLEARFTSRYEPMDADVRARLIEYFRPHNQHLYELLGSELDWDE